MFEEQLVETWQINNRVNLNLLDYLDDDMLRATLSTRGGRTVGQQLAHVIWNRNYRVECIDKELLPQLPPISREEGHEKALLREGFEKTAAVLEGIIRQSLRNDGTVKSFKRGIVPMVGYLISHESHHRGHILLTLKQSGMNPDSRFKMTFWEWNKI